MSKLNKKITTFRLHPEFVARIDQVRAEHSLGTRTHFLEVAAEAYIQLFDERRAGSDGAK